MTISDDGKRYLLPVAPVLKHSKISELVEFATNDVDKIHREIDMGFLPNYLAQQICADTGVKVRDAKKKLNAHGIRHAFAGHSNEQKEAKKNQAVLTAKDFEFIPEILNKPDSFEKGSENNRKGQQAVVFLKRINNKTYYVVMSVVQSKESIDLTFNTMYIKQ